MNSELFFDINEVEARNLWDFLNKREPELNDSLLTLMRRLESDLWDCLSIDEFSEIMK